MKKIIKLTLYFALMLTVFVMTGQQALAGYSDSNIGYRGSSETVLLSRRSKPRIFGEAGTVQRNVPTYIYEDKTINEKQTEAAYVGQGTAGRLALRSRRDIPKLFSEAGLAMKNMINSSAKKLKPIKIRLRDSEKYSPKNVKYIGQHNDKRILDRVRNSINFYGENIEAPANTTAVDVEIVKPVVPEDNPRYVGHSDNERKRFQLRYKYEENKKPYFTAEEIRFLSTPEEKRTVFERSLTSKYTPPPKTSYPVESTNSPLLRYRGSTKIAVEVGTRSPDRNYVTPPRVSESYRNRPYEPKKENIIYIGSKKSSKIRRSVEFYDVK